MHPYIKELAKKPDPTMDEKAVLFYAATVAETGGNEFIRANLKKWLQELNPNKLTGPALSQWAQSIIEGLLSGLERVPEASDAHSIRGDSGV